MKLEPATVTAALAAASSFDEAAAALGISPRSLRTYRRTYGIVARPGGARAALTRETITASLREHGTGEAAARALGYTADHLRRAARALRVPVKGHRGWRGITRDALVDAIARATSSREAAALLGLSYRNYARAKRRHRLHDKPLRRVSAASLLAARDASQTYREAAERLHLTPRQVRALHAQVARCTAISTRLPPITPEVSR